MISHGKVAINGKKVSIPSYVTSVGEKINVHEKFVITPAPAALKTPSWLKKGAKSGEIAAEPSRDMIDDSINENLIIEFYSR